MGIEAGSGTVTLVPDYKKSVNDVYIEAAKFMLASWNNLKSLSLVQDQVLTRLEGLPSWVPDWSVEGFPA